MRVRPHFHIGSPDSLQSALNMWTLGARAQLLKARKKGRPLPPLYRARVRYQREHPGRERWKMPLEVLADGHGDCEDLAAWRAAELQLRGIPARVVVGKAAPGLWHVRVQTPDGWEDPSRRLGMKGAG